MNKKIKKEVNSYIREISKQAKAERTLKRVVLNDLKDSIFELYNKNNSITIKEVYNRFGTPSEISRSFDELSTEELVKKAKKYKIFGVLGVVFIISLIILLFFILQGYLDDITIIN